jgi:hypothetical protein
MPLNITLDDVKECIIGKTVLTTLTNYGYVLYTLNMLKSLCPYGLDKKVLIISMDQRVYQLLQRLGYNTICIETQYSMEAFHAWNTKGYDKICYYKVELIYRILSLGANILLIDGDIVFCNDPLPHIKEWNIARHDVWIQNDTEEDTSRKNMCTGYMFVRSNMKMITLYDCMSEAGVQKYLHCAYKNNDQSYFNLYVKPSSVMFALPLALYPNGKVFYVKPDLKNEAILIHFNWVKGHEKMAKMKEHGLWLLTDEEEDL